MSYLESPILICLFTMHFYVATMMIKGSLLLSSLPVVFNDYFQLNNCVHLYVIRSSDKIHLFVAKSSYGRVVRGSGRPAGRVGLGRVGSNLYVCVFFVISRYFEDIRTFDRQQHSYVGWLITQGCMPTICKCEETLCVKQ